MCEWHPLPWAWSGPPPPTLTNQWRVIDCLPRAHESLSFPWKLSSRDKIGHNKMGHNWAWKCDGESLLWLRGQAIRLQTSESVLNKILSGDGMLSPGLSKPLLPLSSCEPLSVLWAPTIPASNCQVLDTFQDKTKYFTRWYFMSSQNVCPLCVFFCWIYDGEWCYLIQWVVVSGVRMSLMLILLLCSDCQDIETTLMWVLWGCNEPFSHTLTSVTDTWVTSPRKKRKLYI